MGFAMNWTRKLFRVKTLNSDECGKTKLARVLSTLDLTFLGVGSTLGVGIYVLSGKVARESAGPAVSISFIIAAVASAFAGLCYAEFGARVPKSGSAYVYCYCTIGELIAFLIGWNLILEYVIGTASVTKAFSTYLDHMVGCQISDFLISILPMNSSFVAEYPDFIALGVAVVFSVYLAVGLKGLRSFNNVFTCLNLCVVGFVIVAGAFNAKIENWSIPKEQVPSHGGEGGFMPFGFAGIIKGAATCFYGFIGFDCIATTGEEAKTPQKSIPIAIVLSLFITFLTYFGISIVSTMMLPYYDQDINAPLSFIFDSIGWTTAKWIVSIGALFGLLPSLLGSLIPLPRIIYALASDGLLFEILGKVSEKYQSPLIGTIFSGVFTGIMALIFDLSQLIDMMSIGTLLAYTIVAACVLILRYRGSEEDESVADLENLSSYHKLVKHFFQCNISQTPTKFSSKLVALSVLFYSIFMFGTMFCIVNLSKEILEGETWVIVLLAALVIISISLLFVIASQPKSKKKLYFEVPLVPFIPAFSIASNIYLMVMLDSVTWIRFGVWISLGIIIYFAYGIKKSKIQIAESLETHSKETVNTDSTAVASNLNQRL